MSDTAGEIAARIREALEKRGWSQRMLADKAMLGEATVFRLLKGEFSRKSLLKVEEVLGLSFDGRDVETPPAHVADLSFGAYARDLYDYYEGDYLCVRPAFSDPDKVSIYEMEIAWCDETQGLTFIDRNPGYEQRGVIYVPTGTQFLHFVTLDTGSARLITAYHMPPGENYIRAMVMTFANPQGRALIPAAVPLVMCRREQHSALGNVQAGLVSRTERSVSGLVEILKTIECAPLYLRDSDGA